MKFNVKADTMVIFNGKIKTIKAGEFETADKELCSLLENVKGVEKQVVKKPAKQDQE